ncbi:MAG TPA: ATP-dependent Clp protease proteolytic subunit [Candidatus Binatia bacterium]|jgi:ClpP class serine protease|nr:ATP-dependent Clp protease proteolytic subunit [Candidatus Binatia bacterium]
MKRLLKWIFSWRGFLTALFILFFVMPAIATWRLESLRERAIKALEQKRGSRVIVLMHRQESINVLGIPLVRYINIEDSEAVLRAIRFTDKNTPLDLVLHTPGGLVLAASQIAKAIKRHPAKTTVFVPHYAMSGGTLIALAANEIVMDTNAVLGPIDPQLGDFPAASVLKVLEKKPVDKVHDLILIMADQSKKAIAQVTALAQELLSGKMPPEKAKEVAHRLASGTWTHDFPITVETAKDLIGLPVSTEIPEEVFQLTSLYPQAREGQPSVFYLPGPRYKKGEPPGQEAALP